MNYSNNYNSVVFLVYAHSTQEHRNWVLKLANDLCSNGIKCIIDMWFLHAGQSIVEFMKELTSVDKIVIICDEKLNHKLESSEICGIQTEFRFINTLIQRNPKQYNFIPVIKNDMSKNSIPLILQGLLYINFGNSYETKLEELVRAIYNQPKLNPPPLGSIPYYVKGTI